MPAQRTRYTDEYRREAADYALSSGRPITETAADLGLNSKTPNNWVVCPREELANPHGSAEAKAEDAELRAARKRIRELEMENEFLKKASAHFARE